MWFFWKMHDSACIHYGEDAMPVRQVQISKDGMVGD